MNSYRAPTMDLTNFKPMFRFYTPYTPLQKSKNLLISDAIFWGVGGR